MYMYKAMLINIAFITVLNTVNNIFSASFCDKKPHQFTEGDYLKHSIDTMRVFSKILSFSYVVVLIKYLIRILVNF